MNKPKITTAPYTTFIHEQFVFHYYDDYSGDLTPELAALIRAYGMTPDPDGWFFGLSEEDAILRHDETGALLIAGPTGHKYAAEELVGTIEVMIEDSHMNDLCRSYDDGSCSALEDGLAVEGLDATIEDVGEGSVVLKGRVTLSAVADILALPWATDVEVR